MPAFLQTILFTFKNKNGQNDALNSSSVYWNHLYFKHSCSHSINITENSN